MYRRTGGNEPASAEKSFNQLFTHVSYHFKIIGVNALDPGYSINRRTIYTVVALLIVCSEILYFLWTQRSDMIQFLATLPYVSFAIQGIYPLIIVIAKPSDFLRLRLESSELFDLLNESVGNRPMLDKPLRIGTMIQQGMTRLYAILVMFMLVIPVVVWWFIGEPILILNYRIPGVDETTTEGFFATLALHVAVIVPAFCGYLGIDSLFLALIAPVVAFVDAIANEIEELNQTLKLTEHRPIQLKLNRIIQLHQLLVQHVQTLEDHYNMMILMKIGGILFGMISSILAIFIIQEPIAFIFLISLFVQLTQVCLFGSVFNIKNEHMADHLYGIKWYLLPTHQAKQLTLMLARAQNAPTLTVGKFAALDLVCYDQIMRKIYSFVMLLWSFLK